MAVLRRVTTRIQKYSIVQKLSLEQAKRRKRISNVALQVVFSAPLQPQDQSPGSQDGSARSDAMDDELKHSLDTDDDVGLEMIKACDSDEAPRTILSMKPVPADDNHVSNLDI